MRSFIVFLVLSFSSVALIETFLEPVVYARTSKNRKTRKVAKSSKSKKKSQVKGRERHLVREARTRGDSTNIDFEKTSITGQRKTPLGLSVGQGRTDKDYDFIKIRMSWHPEMIQSAKSLDTGNDS